MAYTEIVKGQPDWDKDLNSNFQQVQTDFATDKTMTTVHNLAIQSGFSGVATLITYMQAGVQRVALRIAIKSNTSQILDNTMPLVATPDISKDLAVIAGKKSSVDWMYTPAKVWQIPDAGLLFAFHDGYGYLNRAMSAAMATTYLLMVDADMILI